MTSINYPGEAKTLIEFASEPNATFKFEEKFLKDLLSNDSVKGRKIAIVSITGAFRRGKSFLLDYFLRYLYLNVCSVLNKRVISSKIILNFSTYQLIQQQNPLDKDYLILG